MYEFGNTTSQMSHYPKAIIPSEIVWSRVSMPDEPVEPVIGQFMKGIPPNPELQVPKPIGLKPRIKMSLWGWYLFSAAVAFVFPVIGWLIAFALVYFVRIYAAKFEKSYPKRIEIYNKSVLRFNEESEKFKLKYKTACILYEEDVKRFKILAEQRFTQELVLHTAKIAQIRSPENVKKHQSRMLRNSLRKTDVSVQPGSDAPHGAQDKRLAALLSERFPDLIFSDWCKYRTGYSYPYTPDVLYYDENSRLCIDIEIDEPYSFSSKEPIHCSDDGKDRNRDDFFLSCGWVVIRFSEEQVVRWPTKCVDFVEYIVSYCTNTDYESMDFAECVKLPKRKTWDYHEARRLVQEDFRQNY
jgi:hypothetical protein